MGNTAPMDLLVQPSLHSAAVRHDDSQNDLNLMTKEEVFISNFLYNPH